MDWHTVDRKGDAGGGTTYLAYRLRWTGTKNEILLETSKVVASRKVAAPTVPTPAPPGKVIERQAQPRTGKQQGLGDKVVLAAREAEQALPSVSARVTPENGQSTKETK